MAKTLRQGHTVRSAQGRSKRNSCYKGHLYTVDNTVFDRKRKRVCLTCCRAYKTAARRARGSKPRESIVGRRFGRWAVLERRGSTVNSKSKWLCRCDCGTEKVVSRPTLRSGASRSCGCLVLERVTTHGKSRTVIYGVWAGMMRRCIWEPLPRYGLRGIAVCERWQTFENFDADMGPRPRKRLSLGRINNDGNYEPGNVRWETQTQQMNNMSANHHYKWNGKTRTIAEWALAQGMDRMAYNRFRSRLYNGWSFERAILTPKGCSKNAKAA